MMAENTVSNRKGSILPPAWLRTPACIIVSSTAQERTCETPPTNGMATSDDSVGRNHFKGITQHKYPQSLRKQLCNCVQLRPQRPAPLSASFPCPGVQPSVQEIFLLLPTFILSHEASLIP